MTTFTNSRPISLTVRPDRHGYISVAETAKLVRQALKAGFPGVKFSVRSSSYSGGASIDVTWTDGPTGQQVDAVTGQFCGGRFDGMIDMAYSVRHWLLPDGTAVVAHNPGTLGNGGSNSGEENAKPHPDAVPVRFGADYIFSRRELSVPFLTRIASRVARRYGVPVPSVVEGYRSAHIAAEGDDLLPNSRMRVSEAIWRAAQQSLVINGCLVELHR